MATFEKQVPTGSFPLVVMQYEIKGHPTRSEHWGLMVLHNEEISEVHELRGNFDTFEYTYESKGRVGISKTFRGGCVIGYLRPDQVSPPVDSPGRKLSDSALIKWLRTVDVIRGDTAFDCQVWIIRALVVLREKGVVYPGVNEAIIREQLKLEMDRDEFGEDLIHERLFNHSK